MQSYVNVCFIAKIGVWTFVDFLKNPYYQGALLRRS